MNAREEPFTLTVDQYGRLWLHTKQDGLELVVDLGVKNTAFEIMAAKMIENGFDYRPKEAHDSHADNDDKT